MKKKKTKATKTQYRYYAISYRQRGSHGPQFVVFHAPASEIKKWADVDRMSPGNPSGAQRPLREMKARKVARFFEAENDNTIPTAIVVAIDKSAITFDGKKDPTTGNGQHGVLGITANSKKPGLIIDGQHRVYGAAETPQDIRLNVVALLGADDAERAFQFVVINNSANRVSPDHIKALNLTYKPEVLNKRLLQSARLGLRDETYEGLQVVDTSKDSPFHRLIKWQRNAKGFIVSTAVEAGIKETKNRSDLLGISELEIDFFLLIWSRVKKKWSALWNKDTHLLQKVSIQSLTIFVLDALANYRSMSSTPVDLTEEQTAQKAIDLAIERIPSEFWTVEWSKTELDTRLGQEILLRTLRLMVANSVNGRAWHEGLEIVSPAALKEAAKNDG